jgi:hypothetical protein
MRSFFIALLFLLIVSYWSHLIVTREADSNEVVTVIIDKTISTSGICECRCCLLTGVMCESIIRHSIEFKNHFSCDLCTDDFCMKNISQAIQCPWMYTMKAGCFQHEHRHDSSSSSFVSVRPFFQ